MTERIRRLVAGVGTLQEMDPVIPAAAALAADAGLPLELVHAFDVSDPFVAAYLENAVLPGDPLRRYAEGVQARLEGQVGGLNARGEVRCHAAPGPPAEVLHSVASDPGSLLVVGPTRRGRAGSVLLGTTARRVLLEARAPVLVLRGGHRQPPRVLFSVDLSWPGAPAMVREGLAIVEDLFPASAPDGRILTVVGLDVDLPIPELRERLAGAAAERLAGFAAATPQLEQRVRAGPPAAEVVAEATEWRADLVVVGTRGRTGVARAILGSVAEAVMRDAPCSVLMIPGAHLGEQGSAPAV